MGLDKVIKGKEFSSSVIWKWVCRLGNKILYIDGVIRSCDFMKCFDDVIFD